MANVESLLIPMRIKVQSVWDRTAGTNIGNMTQNAGLAASFDGTTNQVDSACSRSPNGSTGWIGKTFTSPQTIYSVGVYSTNNEGWNGAITTGNNAIDTLDIMVKNGSAPSSGSDGTSIGQITTLLDANNTLQTINSSNTSSSWDHCWLHFQKTGTNSFFSAEVIITVLV